MAGVKLHWRVECIHGFFETENKPQAAFCGHCKKPLKAVEIGVPKNAAPFVPGAASQTGAEIEVVPRHQNTDKEA